MSARPLLGVLISGRGSNLRAIVEAERAGRLGEARVAVVISNRADAAGLDFAREAGIATQIVAHREFPSRETFDRALVDALRARGVTLVCLAGFMRLLGPTFCDAFPQAVLNIHPSLLPSFPGTDAQAQAVAHGVKLSGATVHLVTPELDAGPIVRQAAVPVEDVDTAETLSARILRVEHEIYPRAIRDVVTRRWRVEGRRVVFEGADS
jgi:phosphoribosylglycinamide formyltransferase-1